MNNMSTFFKIVFGVLVCAVVVFAGLYSYFIYKGGFAVEIPVTEEQSSIAPKPPKTEFGTELPSGFLAAIPLEAKLALTQSYGLDYGIEKQLTAVFDSSKTVLQNYGTYLKFLNNDGWTVQNTHEEEHISSLYGIKGNSDINITISDLYATSTVKSQVSISILNK